MRHLVLETMPAAGAPPSDPVGRLYLDAVLLPNRSLPNHGYRALLIGLGGLGLIAATFYLTMGAWPVLGFFGLELLLVWLAFKNSYRQGRLRERVRVWAERVHVARRHPSGHEQHWALAPLFARVEIDEPVRHDSQVRVSSRGRTLVLGSFLAPEERGEFAAALRRAIDDALEERAAAAPQGSGGED